MIIGDGCSSSSVIVGDRPAVSRSFAWPGFFVRVLCMIGLASESCAGPFVSGSASCVVGRAVGGGFPWPGLFLCWNVCASLRLSGFGPALVIKAKLFLMLAIGYWPAFRPFGGPFTFSMPAFVVFCVFWMWF